MKEHVSVARISIRTRLSCLVCVWVSSACAAEAPSRAARPAANVTPAGSQCEKDDCGCETGALPCPMPAGSNAAFQPVAQAGTGSTLIVPTPPADAGATQQSSDALGCRPGRYEGSYSCDIALFGGLLMYFTIEGRVAFTLERDTKTVQNCMIGSEFCADLVISKDSGFMSAQAAGIYAFGATLDGGLDCRTGQFRAAAINGLWGLFEGVADTSAPPKILDPALGMFDGSLEGVHTKGAVEAIGGNWNLYEHDLDARCVGPFNATWTM